MKVSGDLVQIKNKSLQASGLTPFSRSGGFEVLGHTVNCQDRAQRKGGNNLTQAARELKATVGSYQVFADVVCALGRATAGLLQTIEQLNRGT